MPDLSWPFFRICSLACASLLILGAPPLRAATLTNCASATALINAVEAGVNVKFSCASTYSFVLTTPLEITTPIVLEAVCTNVTLTASNAGRLFVVRSGGSLTLVNLTLANGMETNGGGGAILNQGTLLATNCTFSGNNVAGPAGADGKNGRNRVGDLDGHDAASGSPGLGGAVYNSGSFIARRCTFKSNQALGGDGGKGGTGGIDFGWPGTGGDGGDGAPAYGGAIYSEGSLLLMDCTFSANIAAGGYAGDGGASGGEGANPGDGGAGAAAYGAGVCNAGTMTLINCTFLENEAQAGNSAVAGAEEQVGLDAAAGGSAYGGACFNYTGATGAMVNCTFDVNSAFGGAGGAGGSASWGNGDGGNGGNAWGGNVYNGGTLGLTNCTLSAGAAVGGTNGLAGSGSGSGRNGKLGAQNGGNLANSGGLLRLKNCILDASASGSNAYGAITDLGNNLSSDATPVFTAASSRNNLDPKLAALASNGGVTQTLALLDGSPAVDAADAAASPALDQRGQERCGGGPDIGAFERQVSRISGQITSAGAGLSGILITCTNRTYVTSVNGYFEFSLEPGPTYMITPILDNYLAVPTSINVMLGRVNTNLVFTAIKLLTLTGRLTQGTNCLSGARITIVNTELSLTNVTTSDTNGYFTLAQVPAGALTITPELTGYTFNPPSQSLSLNANATLTGFAADRQVRMALLRTNNSLTLQGTGAAAQSYAVQLATNWQNSTQLVWKTLTNMTADSNGLFSLPVVTTNGTFRFYRMFK